MWESWSPRVPWRMEMNEEYKTKRQLQTYFWYSPLSRTLVMIVYVSTLILDDWTLQEPETVTPLPD